MRLLDDIVRDRRRLLLAIALILILAAVLRFYNIQWSFSNNGIDEGVMIERALMVSKGYALYSQLPCDQAPLGFYFGALLGGQVVPLRVLTGVISIAAIGASMLAARRLHDARAMLLTGIVLTLDFVYLRESRLFSLDMLSSSFIAFAIPPFLAYVRKGATSMLVISGLMVGLSAASKLFGALGLIAMIVYIALEAKVERKGYAKPSVDLVVVIVSAAVPLLVFAVYLGPGDLVKGMLFEQSQRGFDPFLKLSIVAYFAIDAVYVLPLLYSHSLWRRSKETKFVLCLTLVILVFLLVEPLIFLHHMVLLSPPMAILAGVVLAERINANKSDPDEGSIEASTEKRQSLRSTAVTLLLVTMLVSAGLATYGLELQGRTIQSQYANWLSSITGPDDFVISGDPLISALADRMTPPDMVNVAYRQYQELTLQAIEHAIEQYNVSVVIVCYRLNDIEGLTSYLTTAGFRATILMLSTASGSAVLDLFQKGIGPIAIYERS